MGILAQLRESVDPAIVYWLFCVLKLCIRVLDFFMDLTFGYTITHGSRRERAAAANKYESSAQVVRVVARAGYCLVLNHELHNFCWAHEKYAHPEIVLGSDRILMFGFNETHAFFTVSREDLYDCEARDNERPEQLHKRIYTFRNSPFSLWSNSSARSVSLSCRTPASTAWRPSWATPGRSWPT